MTGSPDDAPPSEGPLVAVVGAGVMGEGIAQLLAAAGCPVLLSDARPGAAQHAVATVTGRLAREAAKGRLSPAAASAATQRVRAVEARSGDLGSADLAVETVVEDLAVKRTVLRELEELLGPAALIATNTSSLSVTELGAALEHPERLVGLHFFNPAPRMRLVEVVAGERTGAAALARAHALVARTGHRAVQVADTPGFLVNHAGRAYVTEALRLLDEGVAPVATIDAILRDAAGFPMGPFELMDLTGLDVSHPTMESVWSGFYADPRLRPSPTARRRLVAGRLGRKTGEGFYRYAAPGEDRRPGPAPAATRTAPAGQAATRYDGTPLWLPADGDAAGLAGLLRSAGVSVESGPRPGPEAVAVVTPWGSDVTTATLDAGLPPQRTVGVDPYGGFARRLTLAGSPATTAAAVRAAHTALARTGRPVSVVADSTGFVAQRVLAGVVNLGCEIAQLGIATVEDLDAAVRLALGYPRGPLEWGDEIGPDRVLRVLDGLWTATRDPRYRPSPWLSRRARLGLSLLHPGPGLDLGAGDG